KDVDELAASLKSKGYNALPYHALQLLTCQALSPNFHQAAHALS
ncbi:MAG: hypothetical protein K0Q50_3066, partial [Vampirovibrio sp.]|nr:hypothetical protein [Vampirovibrio sp.]